jgi:hypothetical protein
MVMVEYICLVILPAYYVLLIGFKFIVFSEFRQDPKIKLWWHPKPVLRFLKI